MIKTDGKTLTPICQIFHKISSRIFWHSASRILIHIGLCSRLEERKEGGNCIVWRFNDKNVTAKIESFKMDKFLFPPQVLDPPERRRREPSGGTNYFAGTLSFFFQARFHDNNINRFAYINI